MTTPHHPGDHPESHASHERPSLAASNAAPPVVPMARRRLLVIGGGIVVLLILLLVVTLVPRHVVDNELRAESAAHDSAAVVRVALVRRTTTGGDLSLPGTIQALHEAAIYARVPGYVKRWNADIGTTVRAGQVLAEIDAPELEQNVQQAQAQLSQARAALNLAKADLERWRVLARDSAVTGQELDQKKAAYESAVANTGASEANLRRLVQTRQYTRVTAPFTGVVTARNVDLGSLITAAGATSAAASTGGSSANAGNLFRIAGTDTVRTYVNVPESYATSIRAGMPAEVTVQGLGNRMFTGVVARSAGALDVASRTLLTEVDIPNRDFALLPGMYAQVRMRFPRATPPLLLPAGALVIRSEGPQVVILERDRTGQGGTVHFRTVELGRDYGKAVEVASGLIDGQEVVMNAGADLVDGARVRVAAVPASEPARAPR